MKKITFLLFFLYSLYGYCQFPEGFENSATNLPTNWNQYQGNVGQATTWSISPQACQGSFSAFIDKDTSIKNGETTVDYLVTPLTTVPNNGQLRFFARQGNLGDQETIYRLMVSTSSDKSSLENYIPIKDWTEEQMNADYNVCEEKIVDISAYKGKQVYFAFVRICTKNSTNGSGDQWWIDNVNIVTKCTDPSAGVISNALVTSATLSWTDAANSLWDIELVTLGSKPTTNPTHKNVTKPFNLSNLQPNTSYQFYVRAVCSASSSNWVGPFDFKTLPLGSSCEGAINVSSLPYQSISHTLNYPNLFNGPQNSGTSCGATPPSTNYFAGNDVFYSYTATKNALITVKMTSAESNTSLFVYGNCPISGACLAGVANTGSSQRVISNFAVTAGTTYIIALSSSAATPKYGYTLLIQEENCAPPTESVSASEITTTSAKLTWNNPTSATEWRVAIQPLGSPIPEGEGDVATTNPYTATNLTAATAYQYYVRSLCPNGKFSSWSGPYTFNTLVCENIDSNKCDYVFNISDVGANGWNGATMQVRQKGIVIKTIGSTLTGKGPESITVKLCKDEPYDLYWDTAGTKPNECVVSIKNSFGQTLYTKPAGTSSAGTLLFKEDKVDCSAPRCDVAPDELAATPSAFAATLTWNGPAALKYDVYIIPKGKPAPTAESIPNYTNVNPSPFVTNNNLLADTEYTFYVRVHCASSNSNWSAGYTFKTVETCPKPVNPTAPQAETTLDSATLYWEKGTPADSKWEILLVKAFVPEYGTPAAPDPNPVLKTGDKLITVNSPLVSPFTANGLETGTIYYYYIRTVCSDSNKSVWVGPAKFNTLTCNTTDTCKYTFVLTDSGNNGWEGARIQVRQNGIIIGTLGSTMTTGGPTNVTLDICKDIAFDLYWSAAGLKPNEIGVKVISPYNDPLYTKLPGEGTVSDILYTSTGNNCNAPSCPKPTALNIQSLGSNSATLGWTEAGSATKWQVYFVPAGTTPPVNDNSNITNAVPPYYIADTKSFTKNDLETSTTYDFYVRALCSGTSASTWTLESHVTFITKPTNDECDAPINVAVNTDSNETLITTGNTTKGATATLPATNPVCQGFADDDVWFSFVATSTIHTISLKNATGTSTNLNHTLYEGSGCASALTQLYCSNPDLSVAKGLTVGNTYKIRIYTDENGTDKSSTFDVCITTPPVITNDDCSSAVALTVNPDLVSTTSTAGTVTGASASLPTSSCVGNANDDVWYKFVATSSNLFVLLEDVKGSSTDLNHAVYSGNCDTMNLVYCSNANSLQGGNSTYTVGETYYVRVWSNAIQDQSINFNISVGTIVPAITTSITKYTRENLVKEVLIGSPCINVSNITTSTGVDYSTAATGIGYFNKSQSAFPFKEGVILSTGSVVKAADHNTSFQSAGAPWWPGDYDVENEFIKKGVTLTSPIIGGALTMNATKVEFDVVPVKDKISFNYIFASEEYGNAQCGLADSFVILLTDTDTNQTTNIATIPNTNLPVSVITLRDKKYKQYCSSEHAEYFGQFYGPNGLPEEGAPANFNGFTVPMKAEASVVPGKTYHIKMVIIDNQSFTGDSAVFIESGSFDTGSVDLGADLLQSAKTALCQGTSYTIQSGLNTTNYTIKWSKDGNEIPNQTGADLQVSEPGTYAVSAAINNSACVISDSVVIEYYNDVTPGTPTDMTKCDASNKGIFNLAKNSAAILSPYSANHNVSYFISSDNANGNTNPIENPENYENITNPQTIYARVDNTETNCHQIVTFKLELEDKTPDFKIEGNALVCKNATSTLTVVPLNGYNPSTVTYAWTKDAATVSDVTSQSLIVKGTDVLNSSVYTVTVNDSGCTATKEITLSSTDCNIQKGISPDGDESNDNLDLTAMSPKRVAIFNRYGTEVYSKDNYLNEWHGQSNNGEELPDGTYFYEITTNENQSKSGWIYISRKL